MESAPAVAVQRVVRPRSKDERMAALYRITVCAPYDSPGIVRTGREWFDRYMMHPWERGSDFELVV